MGIAQKVKAHSPTSGHIWHKCCRYRVNKKKNLSHTVLNLHIVWLKRVMSKQVTACANADCVRSLGALTSVTYLSWCNGGGMLHRPSSIRRQRSRALDRLLVECGGVAASSQSVRNVRNQTHFRNRWTAHWVHSTPRTPRIHETNRGARAGQEELQKLSLSFFQVCADSWMLWTLIMEQRNSVFDYDYCRAKLFTNPVESANSFSRITVRLVHGVLAGFEQTIKFSPLSI